MRPTDKQASERCEEISLPGTPRQEGSLASASDEISGVFRFLRDYRLAATPPPAEWQSLTVSDSGSIALSATGASIAGSRGAGAPPHTPMGSTTRLIVDSPPSRGCRCLPGLGGVLTALSLTISLANIIRLPTMVFLHGGGSFLVVYVVLAAVFGIPLVFLEVLLGQFSQEGTTKLWRAVPLLKGIGFLKVLASVLAAVYYPVLMSVALFFAFCSLNGSLPLSDCTNQPKDESGEACLKQTLLLPPDQGLTWFGVNVVLLFTIWILVMVCLCRNSCSYRVSSSILLATVVTALVALLMEQIEIDTRGLDMLMEIDYNKILNVDTVYYAVIQLFFSTHIGFGNITTVSGKIYSKTNAFWISVVYVVCNVAVGLAFTCLVYMWISKLEDQGVALARPDIPELFLLTFVYDLLAHNSADNVQLWAVVTFLVIVLAGLTSIMAFVFTVTTSVAAESKERWRTWLVTAGFCSVCFIAGIVCLLPGKLELVHLLEHYVVSRIVVTATAAELIGFLWVYGSYHLYNDFEFVLGYKLTCLWNLIWFTTPICIIALQIWSVLEMPIKGTSDKTDPKWLYITGWAIFASAWAVVLLLALWQIISQVDYNVWQKFLSSLKPSRNWGPVDPIQRHGWVVWREQCTLTGERDFTLKRRGTRDYTHSVRRKAKETLASQYTEPSKDGKPTDTLNGTYTINTVPRYSSTDMRGPYTVQLPDQEHVCWRKDMTSRSRPS